MSAPTSGFPHLRAAFLLPLIDVGRDDFRWRKEALLIFLGGRLELHLYELGSRDHHITAVVLPFINLGRHN